MAGVADASNQVRFGVAGVGVCEMVMCTECAFTTPRQVLHKSVATESHKTHPG